VGKIVDEVTMQKDLNASPQFIGALAEIVWTQIESVAVDIESFAHVSFCVCCLVSACVLGQCTMRLTLF